MPREVIRAQGKSVAAFVVYNVAFGVAHEGIDNAAHLGGLVSGFLIGMALARPITASARAEARAPYIALVTVAAAVMLVAMAGLVVRSKGRMSPDDRYIAGALSFEHGESPVLAAYNNLVQQSHAGKRTTRPSRTDSPTWSFLSIWRQPNGFAGSRVRTAR